MSDIADAIAEEVKKQVANGFPPTAATALPLTSVNGAPVKPGWQTTEFWGHLLVTIASIALPLIPGYAASPYAQDVGLVVAFLSQAHYSISRSQVKSAAIRAGEAFVQGLTTEAK